MKLPAISDPALSLAIAAFLMLLNGFFVLAEFAIVKVRASRIEVLAGSGSANAALVKSILNEIDVYLSAIQLGITMASLGIGWLAEPTVATLIRPWVRALPLAWASTASHSISFALAFVIITFLHVLVGELTPKSIAIRYPTRSALLSAGPLRFFRQLFYLPMFVLSRSSRLLLRLFRVRTTAEQELTHSDEELRILLSQAQEHGSLPLPRLLLFENLFDFGHTSVKDVMTPAGSIAYLALNRSWAENLAIIRARKHTRYPLCASDLSDIKGIVHIKDLLVFGDSSAPDLNVLRRAPIYLPEDAPLEKALTELRKKRMHLALVHNRLGQVVGLITLEDVLEELVGEIHDEFESPPTGTLSDAIVHEAIITKFDVEAKAEALRRLLQKLVAARPGLNYDEIWEVIWKREQTLSSAVGQGFALPHGRLSNLKKPLIAIGSSSKGIDFDSPDRKPVYLIFLILTPLQDPGAQLRLLAKVAALASHNTFRRNLRRAQSSREVLDVVTAFEQSVAE